MPRRKLYHDNISLDAALEIISSRLAAAGVKRLPGELIPVSRALSRVTAAPVFARYSSPYYHSAAMDGFAVNFRDTLSATEISPLKLNLGKQAIPVDTGDPLPDCCNAVIMLEDTNRAGDSIEVYAPVTPYKNVRTAGEDIIQTEMILSENHLVRPVDIGAVMACGHAEMAVVRKPKVVIIPTGTELISPEAVTKRSPVAPEIIEYNSAMLAALANECGAEPLVLPVVKDDPEIIKRILLEAVEKADLVIINAGSGKGSEDFTSSVLSGLGELLFNGVAIKPGKPVIAALVHKKPVLGIPGYPVSAFITFRLFAIPLIERLLGLPPKKEHSIRAVMSRQLSSSLGIDEFVRVNVGFVGERHIAAPAGRGAGLLMSVVRADGMVRIPRQLDGIAAGSEVEVEIFRSTEQIDKAVVSIGSHDNALDLLANSIRRHHPGFSLASSHVGSMGGLMAVRRGEAHMAGIHLLDENTGEYNVPFIKAHIPDKRVVLINFVYRIQGLVVKKGNPKGIAGLNDLLRDDIVFVNRQAGSGTRLLLDKSLADLGIDTERVSGYRNDEYTHMAVASSVQTGLADAGLAVFSAAAALGLDFIPIAEERYDLLIPREFLGLDKIEAMIRTLRQDQEFREEVKAMGGYDTRDMGKLLFES